MRKSLIIVIVAVLIIVLVGSYLSWNYLANQTPDDGNGEPVAFSIEQIRDGAMLYLGANHTETFQLMDDLTWSGGRQETGGLGAETYVYLSGSWSVVIDYPVVLNPLYTITIDYASEGLSVNWVGTYQNTTFTENSYTISPETTASLTQEQIRDLTMNYLKIYHNETSTYIQNIVWTGGRVTPEGLTGSETYNYQGSGWNVTIQYPVVLNPTYTLTANYTPVDAHSTEPIIEWSGTLSNGVIVETEFRFNP
ncbi:MAG: hypothetical protein PHY74_00755 [Candidatus Bathyarchaeota archaeon]|nr:hypothetical protein [Candidatus Bathyarchaeota archaeon]MDI9578552.1 hypothetical protein [Thermoproteota archaeon]MDT8781772.1 hypothetical protein [Candidatus Bathyarchaeota archaeon]NLD66135.1 hypothetical protein [Thermoproteota archaeon]